MMGEHILPFSGPAIELGAGDMARAAARLGVDEPAMRAVVTVETGGAGGFLSDGSGRPRILFEAHLFSRFTGGRWDGSDPRISSPAWNRSLYAGGAAEYPRLGEAIELDRAAALRATSWGMFQVLGDNHLVAGHSTLEGFVEAMTLGEPSHLLAFCAFVLSKGLADALRRHDWATFARGYNGTAYRQNRYDQKLAAAYVDALAGAQPDEAPLPLLRIGARGEAVRRLQLALGQVGWRLTPDGIFGRVTAIAVEQFQELHRLVPDGVVGPRTWAALGV